MIQVEAFDDQKAACGLCLFRVLQVDGLLFFEHAFQIVDVVVLKVAYVTARCQDAFLYSEMNALVGEYDVASLRVGRYGASYGREAVRVDDAFFYAEKVGQLLLQIQVDI